MADGNPAGTYSSEQLDLIRQQKEEVTDVMHNNLKLLATRQERLSTLEEKASGLEDTGGKFFKTAQKVKWKYRLKAMFWTILGGVFVGSIVLGILGFGIYEIADDDDGNGGDKKNQKVTGSENVGKGEHKRNALSDGIAYIKQQMLHQISNSNIQKINNMPLNQPRKHLHSRFFDGLRS